MSLAVHKEKDGQPDDSQSQEGENCRQPDENPAAALVCKCNPTHHRHHTLGSMYEAFLDGAIRRDCLLMHVTDQLLNGFPKIVVRLTFSFLSARGISLG